MPLGSNSAKQQVSISSFISGYDKDIVQRFHAAYKSSSTTPFEVAHAQRILQFEVFTSTKTHAIWFSSDGKNYYVEDLGTTGKRARSVFQSIGEEDFEKLGPFRFLSNSTWQANTCFDRHSGSTNQQLQGLSSGLGQNFCMLFRESLDKASFMPRPLCSSSRRQDGFSFHVQSICRGMVAINFGKEEEIEKIGCSRLEYFDVRRNFHGEFESSISHCLTKHYNKRNMDHIYIYRQNTPQEIRQDRSERHQNVIALDHSTRADTKVDYCNFENCDIFNFFYCGTHQLWQPKEWSGYGHCFPNTHYFAETGRYENVPCVRSGRYREAVRYSKLECNGICFKTDWMYKQSNSFHVFGAYWQSKLCGAHGSQVPFFYEDKVVVDRSTFFRHLEQNCYTMGLVTFSPSMAKRIIPSIATFQLDITITGCRKYEETFQTYERVLPEAVAYACSDAKVYKSVDLVRQFYLVCQFFSCNYGYACRGAKYPGIEVFSVFERVQHRNTIWWNVLWNPIGLTKPCQYRKSKDSASDACPRLCFFWGRLQQHVCSAGDFQVMGCFLDKLSPFEIQQNTSQKEVATFGFHSWCFNVMEKCFLDAYQGYFATGSKELQQDGQINFQVAKSDGRGPGSFQDKDKSFCETCQTKQRHIGTNTMEEQDGHIFFVMDFPCMASQIYFAVVVVGELEGRTFLIYKEEKNANQYKVVVWQPQFNKIRKWPQVVRHKPFVGHRLFFWGDKGRSEEKHHSFRDEQELVNFFMYLGNSQSRRYCLGCGEQMTHHYDGPVYCRDCMWRHQQQENFQRVQKLVCMTFFDQNVRSQT